MGDNKFSRKLFTLATVAVILLLIINFSPISAFISLLIDITAPITLGLAIAFIINIPLCFFERIWSRIDTRTSGKGRSSACRCICLCVCFLLFFGSLTALIFAIIPQLRLSATALLDALPVIRERLDGYWAELTNFLAKYNITLPALSFSMENILSWLRSALFGKDGAIINKSLGMANSVFSRTFDVALAFVIGAYVLAKKEMLKKQCRRFFCAVFPSELCAKIFEVSALACKTFVSFIVGQVFEAFILGGLCFIGMIIFRMPFPALISVIVGVSALIPIFGAFFGIGVGALFVLVSKPSMTIWFIVFLLVLQQIETNFIYPRVIGKYVGLPAVWVLLSVTVGSSFGVVGILLSVPLFSVIYCLLGRFADEKLKGVEGSVK